MSLPKNLGFVYPKFLNFYVGKISVFFVAKVFFDKLAVKIKTNHSTKNPEILQYDAMLA